MTGTVAASVPRRRTAAVGTAVGVVLVVLAEFLLLTVVYHSGDGSDERAQAWSAVHGAESGWRPGVPTRAVRRAVAALDDVAGSRADRVNAATAAWVRDPTAARFTTLRDATSRLGQQVRADQKAADRRVAIIHGSLLAVVSVGWFLWFRRVVRRQRELQSSLTQAQVAMAGERRLIAMVRNSADLVMVVEPDTSVSFASPSTLAVLGRQPEELLGRRIADLVSTADAPVLTGLLATGGQGDQAVLLHAPHADGRDLVLEGTLTNLLADASVGGWVLTVRDVTEQRALQGRLAHQARHDALTGLANRQLFTELLAHALRARGGTLRPLVVLFIDLDDFKNVNDAHGHGVGDELLVEFAGRLTRVIREGDTAARLGGDEFAVLMEDSDLATGQRVAARLVETLIEPMTLSGGSLTVRASIGLAPAEPGSTTAEEALRNADVAMYFAKDRGKDRVAVYDSELHASALERLEVRTELSHAIQAGELVVHYQPTYHLRTGRIEGFEALVRWQHPQHGLLSPDRFVGIAEQSGLVVPMGRWVLNEACRAAAQDLSPYADTLPKVAVNVSPRQLADPRFHHDVVAALEATGLDPTRLVLEITETVLLDDRVGAVDVLDDLRALGVHVAIDDFGTGYSSLSYLTDLPVEILKIDRSFVSTLGQGGESLVEAILGVANSLGLLTLAEGVETDEQADWLRGAGCLMGQGFLWSRPLPLVDARAALLADRPTAAIAG